jgi:hypothetical protein
VLVPLTLVINITDEQPMSQLITESIVAQVTPLASWVTETLSAIQFLITNSFLVVGALFAFLFMLTVLRVFVKGLKGLDYGDLFRGDVTQSLSLTKFWTNIAYFTATVAFVGKIFMSTGTSDNQNILWCIYLGGVGSNAIASKWLGLKYAGAIQGTTPAPVSGTASGSVSGTTTIDSQ